VLCIGFEYKIGSEGTRTALGRQLAFVVFLAGEGWGRTGETRGIATPKLGTRCSEQSELTQSAAPPNARSRSGSIYKKPFFILEILKKKLPSKADHD
jgi:hypothetical protein